jgi:hypothetical protein
VRVIYLVLVVLFTAVATAGELPGTRMRPASEVRPVLRVRDAVDLMLTDKIDVAKLAAALSAEEIRRTEDNSPMRPNEQVYFAATEQFQSVRLSIERDAGHANATPHTLYLTVTPLTEITLGQLDQTFGAARLLGGPSSHGRTWVYGPLDKRFVAHITASFAQHPSAPNVRPRNLTIRVDRRQ